MDIHIRTRRRYCTLIKQGCLFTIGSSYRSEEEFINLLKENEITLLIDVRSKNGSRVLHFDEARFGNLSRMLMLKGIAYDISLHQTLGGLQNGSMSLGNFRNYTRALAFRDALAALKDKIQANEGNTAILCSERDPKQCHRKIIGDELEREGWHVMHLRDTIG